VQAAQVLGQLRAPEARDALARAALEGESVDLRAKASLALGKIGDPEDVPKLLTAAKDEAWPVRAQAASALGMIGDVTAIPKLQELTVDREWWVRLNASRALANMGPAGERALARLLEDEDRYARDRAAATLEERGITRRAVEELTAPGEKGASARAMIRGMVKAGAVKYLERLARTLPDEGARLALRETMLEARGGNT
jgi:HEAT repeat protein